MSSEFDFGGTVPAWGRGAAEYEAFFALSDVSPSARVLDCGGGPSSFAAEWGKTGRFVVAVDPIYRFSGRDLKAGFETTAARMLAGMRTVPLGPLRKPRTGPPAAPRHPEHFSLRFSISNPERSLRFGEPARVTLPIEVLRSRPLFASAVSVHRGIQPRNAPLLPPGTASGRERGPGISIVRHGG